MTLWKLVVPFAAVLGGAMALAAPVTTPFRSAASCAVDERDGRTDPGPLAPFVAELLAEAVDLRDAPARLARAQELAARDDVSLEQWLAAARAFAPLAGPAREPGPYTERAELWVEGRAESTELHVVVPPDDGRTGPRPLLVALHGAGGNGPQEAATWRGVAAELGALLLAPTEAGDNVGYASSTRESAAVLAAIRWARRHHDVDENRIWITGFSRGGHLCWDVALRHPGLFAAAAPMAGGPRLTLENGANSLRLVENLDGLPTLALAGALDDPALVWTLGRIGVLLERFEVSGAEVRLLDGTGHAFAPLAHADWADWFAARVRDPWPTRVVRLSARAGESRRAWLEIMAFGKDVEETFQPRITVRKGEELSDAELRTKIDELARERTARVVAERGDDGVVRIESENATEARLLVPAEWIDEKGRVAVKSGSSTKRLRTEPDVAVLLADFVEHFDRTRLPVAEVVVKLKSR
ncbi:Alpha/beta hydrolase family protein [Planctomycetes bacterium Pla163]|uniref:Alpha/beta hydrolase family protein n=1 Tax=Rohdeia mirabilis TaxID=2528008 RepID=A0A518CZC7_9BACT|nr:Alpha/beta hydrolase family protein [Planctomycetes bacterium Pla163]